jgi:hypothetical protein
MKTYTNGATEWLNELKAHWDLSKTSMRENDDGIIVMFFGRTNQIMAAFYDKNTKVGWVDSWRRKVKR